MIFGYYKLPPLNYLSELKANYLSELKAPLLSAVRDTKMSEEFEVCELPVINHIQANSHAFIGHAYGAPGKAKETDYIDENVLSVIQKHKHQLKSVSFTGDVFSVPSLAKWHKLNKEVTISHKILIAPGNHDVARPDSRDIFNLSFFGAKSFPFVESLDEVPAVYDDSVRSKWLISTELLELVNSLSSQNIIIARHNIPITDLLFLANSSAHISEELPTLKDFIKKFRSNVSYTWVLGDSGAFSNLPRLSCLKHANHTFILNGIGGVLGDSVVIYKNGQFFKYKL